MAVQIYMAVLLALIGAVMSANTPNRTDLIQCYHCKGADDKCMLSKKPKQGICARSRENCYTMVQTDGVRRIVTRGCAHTRFCKMARRVKLYDLRYCKQCAEEACNKEQSFAYDVDAARMTSSSDVIIAVGLATLVAMRMFG